MLSQILKKSPASFALFVTISLQQLMAQDPVQITRLTGEIEFDGRMTEAAWEEVKASERDVSAGYSEDSP